MAGLHFSLTLPHQIFTEAFGGSGVTVAAKSRLVSSWVRKEMVVFMGGKLDSMSLLSFHSKDSPVEGQRKECGKRRKGYDKEKTVSCMR
jgi:hypothetical protein